MLRSSSEETGDAASPDRKPPTERYICVDAQASSFVVAVAGPSGNRAWMAPGRRWSGLAHGVRWAIRIGSDDIVATGEGWLNSILEQVWLKSREQE
jgi:hypothetical protein